MKTKTFSTMGSLHPVLFFAGVYIVALLFSIFICSSLFYSCNSTSVKTSVVQKVPVKKDASPVAITAGAVLR